LGLEKIKGACFSSKLGICKGACTKKELYLKYNIRFTEAFTKTRIKKWPFDGPIMIKEECEEGFTGHILDQWCYVGRVVSEYEKESETDISFDYDTYKILERYLKDTKHSRNIQHFSN
ncbi:MAG TPA: hypothetical protein VK338_03600, partial [Candidatus Nitrosocosmicus sp.]|nr:hypothetical protein [Candidatus Nitrosocosmicus sp.]